MKLRAEAAARTDFLPRATLPEAGPNHFYATVVRCRDASHCRADPKDGDIVRTCSSVVGIVLAGIVLAGTWLAAPPAAAQAVRVADAQLITALNDCLQDRFKDVDEGFGFRRIVRIGETPHRFTPENARELTAVRGLERAGLRVVLYLTGRRVLQPRPDRVVPGTIVGRRIINGPVLVTSAKAPVVDAPAGMDLWDESRRAIELFGRAESHEFTMDAWTFTARPVRAMAQACLRCHSADGTESLRSLPTPARDLHIGDPLGIVLYGVQREQ